MSTRRHSLAALVALAALLASSAPACAPKPPPAPIVAVPPPLPDPLPPPPPPAGTYWEPIDVAVHGKAIAPELPLDEAELATVGGAASRWGSLTAEARAAVLERGFTVVPRATPSARFGQAYAALGEADVPYVVTLDTLFWVAHVARDRALAAAEEAVLVPALATLLRRLELRLGSEAHGAPGDLLAAYPLARGVVSVAQSLLSPAYHPPVDLAPVVSEENRRIAAHEGPSVSPLLGVTVDYSQIVPRGEADASSARAGYARAVAWLGAAPFVLGAKSEVEGAELSVAGARAHTRAVLLIARLVEFGVDVEAAYAWRQWNVLASLVGGASDDVSLRGLLDAARAAGMSSRDPRGFADVVKVDRVRHALLTGHGARLDDGAAVAGARMPGATRDFTRAATSVRIFPSRGPGDAEVLQSLVFPSVGKLILSDADASAPPETSRDGIRALPRALDIGAWLGASEARAILRDRHDDAYEGYDDILAALAARRPPEESRHDSLYSSSLDALATYLAPSAVDVAQPGATTVAWQRRRLEGALAGWATLRHDALAFARFPTENAVAAAMGTPDPSASKAGTATTLAFVEAHPEAIAKLLSLVRQTKRGLRALGYLPSASSANPILDASERILADAFTVALREADDEPLAPEEREAVEAMPSRLAALEASLVASRAAEASLAVDVHTDLVSARALVEACGDLADLYLAFREPQTGRLVLAVGVVASHYEVTERARERPTDTVWRARLHGAHPPVRAEYTRAFTTPAASAEPVDASVAD